MKLESRVMILKVYRNVMIALVLRGSSIEHVFIEALDKDFMKRLLSEKVLCEVRKTIVLGDAPDYVIKVFSPEKANIEVYSDLEKFMDSIAREVLRWSEANEVLPQMWDSNEA